MILHFSFFSHSPRAAFLVLKLWGPGGEGAVPDRRQWFLVDAAYLEPVMTAGKYWVGGAHSWLLGDLSVSPLWNWPLGLPALWEEFVGTMTQGYTAGDASRWGAKMINLPLLREAWGLCENSGD